MDWLLNPVVIGKLSIAIFLSIVFIQSGVDKVFDRKGNLSWLKEHFAKSPLSSFVSPMLLSLTIVELAAGLLSLVGFFCLILCGDDSCILLGIIVSVIAFLMLLFGQRIAKDYAGAQTIVIYLGATLIGLIFFL